MGEFRNWAFLGGGVGTVMIAAAQTKPEEAASNVAGWLRVIGVDRVPAALTSGSADTWVTIGGALLLLAAIAYWAIRRARKTREEADTANLDGLRAQPGRIALKASDSLLEEYDRLTRWAEADARVMSAAKIAGPTRDRDTDIKKALGYAMSGDWDTVIGIGVAISGKMAALHQAIDTFRAAAARGDLRVWGVQQDTGLYTQIDETFWISNTLDRDELLSVMGRGCTKTLDGEWTGTQFHNLMVNRFEVEMVWPHEG